MGNSNSNSNSVINGNKYLFICLPLSLYISNSAIYIMIVKQCSVHIANKYIDIYTYVYIYTLYMITRPLCRQLPMLKLTIGPPPTPDPSAGMSYPEKTPADNNLHWPNEDRQ